jgi:hypothetical protein
LADEKPGTSIGIIACTKRKKYGQDGRIIERPDLIRQCRSAGRKPETGIIRNPDFPIDPASKSIFAFLGNGRQNIFFGMIVLFATDA